MHKIKNFNKMKPALVRNTPMAIATTLYMAIFLSNI